MSDLTEETLTDYANRFVGMTTDQFFALLSHEQDQSNAHDEFLRRFDGLSKHQKIKEEILRHFNGRED